MTILSCVFLPSRQVPRFGAAANPRVHRRAAQGWDWTHAGGGCSSPTFQGNLEPWIQRQHEYNPTIPVMREILFSNVSCSSPRATRTVWTCTSSSARKWVLFHSFFFCTVVEHFQPFCATRVVLFRGHTWGTMCLRTPPSSVRGSTSRWARSSAAQRRSWPSSSKTFLKTNSR